MDLADRDRRQNRAQSLVPDLADRGVVAVATSFVDTAGISRVKAVPLVNPKVEHAVGLVAVDRDPRSPLVSALFKAARAP